MKMPVMRKNKICPFVQIPFHDCYCFNLNSKYIEPAIYYCGNHFTACEIYKKNISVKERHSDKKISSKYVA
jgi:hypothetical protein